MSFEVRTDCLIAFGSNQGESAEFLGKVAKELDKHPYISKVVVSNAISTPPIGGPGDQSDYLNACIRFDCLLDAPSLLAQLNSIEHEMGRKRRIRWASRTVDLDLILFGNEVIDGHGSELIVPHPRMSFRRFVLEPAVEIAGDMIHPHSGRNLRQLLRHIDVTENRIGLASTAESSCLNLLAAFREACLKKGFEFHHFIRPLVPSQTLAQMKLIVYLDNDDETIRSSAGRFPGPTLKLKHQDLNSTTEELISTIEALLPF